MPVMGTSFNIDKRLLLLLLLLIACPYIDIQDKAWPRLDLRIDLEYRYVLLPQKSGLELVFPVVIKQKSLSDFLSIFKFQLIPEIVKWAPRKAMTRIELCDRYEWDEMNTN